MEYKARLLSISELSLENKLEDDGAIKAFTVNAEQFINTFPDMENRLKEAFDKKDFVNFKNYMVDLKSLLNNIHAVKMVEQCDALCENLEHAGGEFINLMSHMMNLSIDLQMNDLKKDDNKAETQDNKPHVPSTGEKLILAVDDTSFFLNVLKGFLKDTRFKLVCVNSGNNAMSFLTNNRPDMFILDINMPDIDGFELAKKIKAAGHTSPIIFLTNTANRGAVVKAVQSGAVDFMVKPIDRNMLITKINKHI